MNLSQITGCDEQFLDVLGGPHRLHPDVVVAFRRLQSRASEAGFELRAVSCYRSFERQRAIWNAKARGERDVLGAKGQVLRRKDFDDWGWAQAILRWSALPGASRHHWGTDLDVFDAAAVAPDYAVQLTPAEVDDGGPFQRMHTWLDTCMAKGLAEDFYRPYAYDAGGIAPERWHLSYAPLALECEGVLSEDALFSVLDQRTDVELWSALRKHWRDIYQRFVRAPVCASELASAARGQ